jgi:hypothetical protein
VYRSDGTSTRHGDANRTEAGRAMSDSRGGTTCSNLAG